MKLVSYDANAIVHYTNLHSLFPDIKLGDNARFDVMTDEGKVIANLYDMENKKLNVGDSCAGKVSIRWVGGIEEGFVLKNSLPIIFMNEQIGFCETSNPSLTEEIVFP